MKTPPPPPLLQVLGTLSFRRQKSYFGWILLTPLHPSIFVLCTYCSINWRISLMWELKSVNYFLKQQIFKNNTRKQQNLAGINQWCRTQALNFNELTYNMSKLWIKREATTGKRKWPDREELKTRHYNLQRNGWLYWRRVWMISSLNLKTEHDIN